MVSLVENLSKRDCHTIDENEKISLIFTLLKRYNIGCLVVTKKENTKPSGIVSERDIVRNFNDIYLGKSIKVKDIMTKRIIYCDMDATSKDIMEIMSTNKIRHLPIIDKDTLKGIVSIGDVVNKIISNYEEETRFLKEYINS